MKSAIKIAVIFLTLLIAQSINAQPLDTLKIKAEADSLKAVADSLRKAWQLDEALETYQTALAKSQQIGDKESEAKLLKGIGKVFSYQGNAQETLHYWEKELAIHRELGDRWGEGKTLGNIGIIYDILSDYSKSLEYYQRSLKIKRELGDRKSESNSLNNIGIIYTILSDYPKALEYYEESLEIKREVGDRRGESETLNNIGTVYYKLSDFPKALEYYRQSLEIARELGDRKGEGMTLGNIGNVYTKQEKYAEAEEYIKQALSIGLELKTEDLVQQYYFALGDCYAAQGLDSLAVENYAKAIETVESIRGKLEVEAQKSSYSAGVSAEYAKMVLSLLKLDRDKEAYNYIERGRARSFLDLLASGKVKVGKSRHEEFLRDEEESQDEIEEMEEQLIAAAEDTTQLLALRGKLEEKRGFITATIEEKKQYEPELASMVTVNSLTLPEVQELLDKESTILEYFLTEEKTLIWLITRDEAEVYQVDIGGDSLKKKVEDFRQAIMNLEDTDNLAGELYDILFAPAEGKIKTKNLVIIPHGILHYLPFHALQDGKGKYLVDRYKIRYLPSASVMKYLNPKRRQKGNKLLAIGNPRTEKKGYNPLKFAEEEVKRIGKLYSNSEIFTDSAATEAKFRELAANYDILHLACHAELNSSYPLFSGLLLVPGSDRDGEQIIIDPHPRRERRYQPIRRISHRFSGDYRNREYCRSGNGDSFRRSGSG
ncbi:MAG: CHAT domain-containing protein, partial [FCB group bacterium]|nr:CHAT domain-containing protein [FCB group bacterium]